MLEYLLYRLCWKLAKNSAAARVRHGLFIMIMGGALNVATNVLLMLLFYNAVIIQR